MLEFTFHFGNESDRPQLLYGSPEKNNLTETSSFRFQLSHDEVILYCVGHSPSIYQMNHYFWTIVNTFNSDGSFSFEHPKKDETWLHILLQGFIEPKEFMKHLFTEPKQGILTGSISQVLGKWGSWTAQIHKSMLTVETNAWIPPPNSMPDQGMSSFVTPNVLAVNIANFILEGMTVLSNTRLILSSYTTAREGQNFLNMGIGPFNSDNVAVVYGRQDDSNPLASSHFNDACDLFVPPALIFTREFRRIFQDYQLALGFASDDSDRLFYLWRAAEEILYVHDPKAQPDTTPQMKPAAENLKLFYDRTDTKQWMKEVSTYCHRFARHAGPHSKTARQEQIEVCRLRINEMIVRHAQFRVGHLGDWSLPQKDALTGWI